MLKSPGNTTLVLASKRARGQLWKHPALGIWFGFVLIRKSPKVQPHLAPVLINWDVGRGN